MDVEILRPGVEEWLHFQSKLTLISVPLHSSERLTHEWCPEKKFYVGQKTIFRTSVLEHTFLFAYTERPLEPILLHYWDGHEKLLLKFSCFYSNLNGLRLCQSDLQKQCLDLLKKIRSCTRNLSQHVSSWSVPRNISHISYIFVFFGTAEFMQLEEEICTSSLRGWAFSQWKKRLKVLQSTDARGDHDFSLCRKAFFKQRSSQTIQITGKLPREVHGGDDLFSFEEDCMAFNWKRQKIWNHPAKRGEHFILDQVWWTYDRCSWLFMNIKWRIRRVSVQSRKQLHC